MRSEYQFKKASKKVIRVKLSWRGIHGPPLGQFQAKEESLPITLGPSVRGIDLSTENDGSNL